MGGLFAQPDDHGDVGGREPGSEVERDGEFGDVLGNVAGAFFDLRGQPDAQITEHQQEFGFGRIPCPEF
ncbi:MAG UNVERIFIED_CONTAM: hypothetical protein LVR18_02675 [Planctomycetaceae bacterium]|jgi:hypothetical protein